MTTITHAGVGVVLGWGAGALMPELFDDNSSKLHWMFIFAVLSNIPDGDLLLHLIPRRWRQGSPLWEYRGITHSILAVLLFGYSFVPICGESVCSVKGLQMGGIFSLVVALHLLCDSLDGSSGVSLFAPWSSRKVTTGYKLNEDLPLDVLSSARGRMQFGYGVFVETLCVTLPIFVLMACAGAARAGF